MKKGQMALPRYVESVEITRAFVDVVKIQIVRFVFQVA